MMTKDEYVARAEAEEEWAPGWLAIDAALDTLYPGVEPTHFGTELHARAIMGGDEFLDGYSFFPSPNGYLHLVSYGMSVLYTDEDSFGGEWSGWGYEMTMKIAGGTPEENLWAVQTLAVLARMTFTSDRFLEPYHHFNGKGRTLVVDSDTLLTSYLVVPDTELPTIETMHGRVDFMQVVGITQAEQEWIANGSPEEDRRRARELAQLLQRAGNPHLVTDLGRASVV